MKIYKYNQAPLEVHGLPFYEQNHLLQRLPAETVENLRAENPNSGVLDLHKRCPGARICFRTNARQFTVRLEIAGMSVDIGMSIFACQSINVMIGPHNNMRFAGLVNPPDYNTLTAEKTFTKSGEMEDITLFFPRNEAVKNIEIEVDDDALVESPTPYKYPPILFYGSSITEGGCCCRVTNSYNALISADLDVDFYNYGFSGSARGELSLADCIADIPMSIFVYDYDHNAPTPEHLKKTHEPFFRRIREKNPDLPVIMVTRPVYNKPLKDADVLSRVEIIRETYENAVNAGDKNVYLIEGSTFFGDKGPLCSVDCTHPNDLGFYMMAETIKPVVKSILEEKYGK